MITLGSWLKEKRKENKFNQKEISLAIGCSQATMSYWENDSSVPSVLELHDILRIYKLNLSDVPFNKMLIGERGENTMERLSLYELPNCDSLKTFDGKTFTLKGFVGIETKTGEIEEVTQLYYRTKTVVKNNLLTAKRKNENSELKKVTKKITINK